MNILGRYSTREQASAAADYFWLHEHIRCHIERAERGHGWLVVETDAFENEEE